MTSMTPAQHNELDRAVERAMEHGIVVLAQGRMKSDNSKFYLTTSSSHPDRGVHVVKQRGMRLECDCEGSRHGHICQHRASVYMYLTNEAARKQRAADAVEQALEAEQQVREQAVLYRDNSAVSLFK
jgi:hypothetical protein